MSLPALHPDTTEQLQPVQYPCKCSIIGFKATSTILTRKSCKVSRDMYSEIPYGGDKTGVQRGTQTNYTAREDKFDFY